MSHPTRYNAQAEVDRLTAWLATVTTEDIRDIETLDPFLRLPSGAPLRGVQVMPGLYLARDRRFYWATFGTLVVQPLLFPDVIRHASVGVIKAGFQIAAFEARRRRAHARRARRSTRSRSS